MSGGARDADQSGSSTAAGAQIPRIGIVGGIGAGKSTVAAAFAALGCAVSDSDAEARALLRRADVRDELVRWWGGEPGAGTPPLLDAAGEISRAAVSGIVFRAPAQRARLEALIHPLLAVMRGALIGAAAARGAPAVIIDAPLLFEAGLERECDAVVFVDTPRGERLRRLASRGWDEGEVTRREGAQMALEDKRGRSNFVIRNDGAPERLQTPAAAVLAGVIAGRIPESAVASPRRAPPLSPR
ncbi:dephospho-CoA kinase [soil metagenome]